MFRCSALVAVFLMTLSCFTHALIVPQEVPSILSLVYSNVPPLRKGTDSRLGWGFRLGEHADFQVVLELGPQKDTRPIGMDDGSNSKRQVNQNDYKKFAHNRKTEESTTAGSWLENWSNDMRSKKRKELRNKQKQQIANNETSSNNSYMNAAAMIPESSLKQLQKLYTMASAEKNPIVATNIPNKLEQGQRPPIDMMSIISPRRAPQVRKTKGEITDELMDIKMD